MSSAAAAASAKKPVAVIVGVGPGLGASVARKFASEGYHTALISRSLDKLSVFEKEIVESGETASCYAADVTEPESLQTAVASIKTELGAPQVLVYNAGAFFRGGVGELTPEQFLHAWKANCFGGFLAANAVVNDMVEAGTGTIIFTGATASLRGSAKFSALAVGKWGLRALAQSLAREVQPSGVHVAHVVLDGQIWSSRYEGGERDKSSFLDPDAIAATYWTLHQQDKTALTFELELRPSSERW